MSLRFGYGSNGFANHRLDDALEVIAGLGYHGVALTLDHAHLDPTSGGLAERTTRVADRLRQLELSVVVETGARYLLDPWRKHEPTLLAAEPEPRLELLRTALYVAEDLGAECVSFWSGALPEELDPATAWPRLQRGVASVLEEAEQRRVPLALEPEPGHLVQHLDQALRLRSELGEPELLGITLDVGHCVAVEPLDAAACIRHAGELLCHVQLDDMRTGIHEHLEFGAGELDLEGTLGALLDIDYQGMAAVELPRHSHAAVATARDSRSALQAAEWTATAQRRVHADPTAVSTLFPAVGRMVGRGAARPTTDPGGMVHGTVDDRARGRLLAALGHGHDQGLGSNALAEAVADLYRYGDRAERRAVLRGLHLLPQATVPVDLGRNLVQDALRSNDTELVAAAVGRFAAEHLDAHSWRHAVLKCLFIGVPLAAVAGLTERTDGELLRMVADFAAEREAAGRVVPPDAHALLETHPPLEKGSP